VEKLFPPDTVNVVITTLTNSKANSGICQRGLFDCRLFIIPFTKLLKYLAPKCALASRNETPPPPIRPISVRSHCSCCWSIRLPSSLLSPLRVVPNDPQYSIWSIVSNSVRKGVELRPIGEFLQMNSEGRPRFGIPRVYRL
jgi:hypothetical protein